MRYTLSATMRCTFIKKFKDVWYHGAVIHVARNYLLTSFLLLVPTVLVHTGVVRTQE